MHNHNPYKPRPRKTHFPHKGLTGIKDCLDKNHKDFEMLKHASNNNLKGWWEFNCSTWSHRGYGSYKQVRYEAKKSYSRIKLTSFGQIFVQSFTPESNPKQTNLPLE